MFQKIEPVRSKGEVYRMNYYGNNITFADWSLGTPPRYHATEAARKAIEADLDGKGYWVKWFGPCERFMISVRVERSHDEHS